MSGRLTSDANIEVYCSHAALRCPMVLVNSVALALGHCIVDVAALTHVSLWRQPVSSSTGAQVMLGEGEGGCHEDGRVASVGSMPGRGRASGVAIVELCC